MGDVELLVGGTTQDLVATNHVYVAPRTFPVALGQGGYVTLSGAGRDAADFVFTVRENEQIAPGTLALNKMQRTCAKLSPGIDKVVARLFRPPAKNFLLSSVTVELDYANVKKAPENPEIDIKRISEQMHSILDNQVLALTQIIGFEVNGVMMKFTVLGLDILNEDTAQIESVAGVTAKHYLGMLQKDSIITFKKPSGRAMRFKNVPKESEVMTQSNLLKTEFNFASYGIGGLDSEADQVFRRAFASRIFPNSFLTRLGVNHVKGIMLYGPPGCGKTLMARQIGKMLNCRKPVIVNGPDILSKYVGESEANVRKLFAEAEKEQAEKGDESELHLIIFDEFDAIVKQRGSTKDNTGVSDNVVNQLLSKIDGVDSLNNVLLVGMTNRKDLIDEALMRPGRFEVQIEIRLPDKHGRQQIFNIHTKHLREEGTLAKDVDLDAMADRTKNYTGAEIEGVVKAAASYALGRCIDYKNPSKLLSKEVHVTMADFLAATDDVRPAFGCSKDLKTYMRRGLYDYGAVWQEQMRRCMSYIAPLKSGGGLQVQSVLLEGPLGTGKTALAAYMAECSGFPLIKVVSGDDMTGMFENSKVNYIKKAFDDAHKSPYSAIVLDELEDLIDYTVEGPRFSPIILQTLRRMIKKVPKDGNRILIIGTTAAAAAMKQLGFWDQWDLKRPKPHR
eukprot:TRINITY_DN2830_c1_g2_i2.p1 TRINITY_DN2830_c1_g2~~TRINITY_DN2830_c1_g2_i2.p1  ORF type:complete len:713 (+),score=331.92 TRINITY_DN2830_c1_g2_i2:115-2139(+)